MAIATTSPFTKEDTRKNLAYYFDDDQIAVIQKNSSSGEWASITSATANADGDRMRIHYHSRYTEITDDTAGLEKDINVDIGVKYGLHLALIDYVRARLAEDDGDLQRSNNYYRNFKQKVKQYPYRKSAVRGIQPYSFR